MNRTAKTSPGQLPSKDRTLASERAAADLLRVPRRVIHDLVAAGRVETEVVSGKPYVVLEMAEEALAGEGQ